jgi:DNA-binding NtrC family response regulator
VRELRNVVERMCILREGKVVRATDLPPAFHEVGSERATQDAFVVPRNRRLDEIVDLVIDAAITAERGNLTRAARQLGVSVRTLQRRARH